MFSCVASGEDHCGNRVAGLLKGIRRGMSESWKIMKSWKMMKCSRSGMYTFPILPLLLVVTAAGSLPAAADQAPSPGTVFSSTNSAFGNAVVMFRQASSGKLVAIGTSFTGGTGTGGNLSNSNAVVLSPNRRYLYAVDAGSNDIAAFVLGRNKMYQLPPTSSGGATPTSLAVYGTLLYVLNAGDTGSITGFRMNRNGSLAPLPGSTHTLSSAAAAASQIGFSPDGEQLIVTERATNKIDVFPVNADGIAGDAIVTASVGQTPFGFNFDPLGHLIVSEAFGGAAGKSAVSSYFVSDFGSLPITGSAPTGQSAACWIAVNRAGTYVWTTNTASGTISAYDLAPNGRLSLLEGGGVVASTGSSSKPTDMALDAQSRYLYVLESAPGAVAAFRINSDGTLVALGVSGDLGPGATGLVVY